MITRIVCLSAFLFLAFTINAQHIDEYLKRDSISVAGKAINTENNIFLIKGKDQNLGYGYEEEPVLYKLDDALILKDSIILSSLVSPIPQNVLSVFTDLAFKGGDTLIVTFNVNFNSSSGGGYVAILDTALNLLSQFSLNQSSDSIRYSIQRTMIEGNKVYLSGSISKATSPSSSSPYIAQYDLFGNKIKECIIPVDTFSHFPFPPLSNTLSIGDFAPVPEGFLVTFYPYVFSVNMALVDSNFNLASLLSVKDKPWGYLLDSHIQFLELDGQLPKLITETTIFSDSIKPTPNTIEYNKDYKNISLITLDSSYAFSSIDTFAFSQNRVIDTFFMDLLRFDYGLFDLNENQDTALVMSTDMEPSSFYYTKPSNTSYLTCFNPQNGAVYWSKTFNNGYAHDATNVVALNGNKWFLTFNEYNWDKFGDETMCIHMMVIDGNGNPIGINENEERALEQEPVIYPNPANNYLQISHLHWPGNHYSYQLTDVSGRVVQSGEVPVSGTIILPEKLHGVYVLSITNQTGFGWAKKVVVE